ncbi:hypothetical protein [Anatilimnocola floriformis]|uniref:hypothetical protein n=1 Tax=Anatilimnocola floriformis TaxID=2948575 RepID=UPI0020C52F8D|nr:hypothetical protein [Anatilimnocola floriformis]
MASILTYGKYLQFGLANADLLADAADAFVEIKAAPTCVAQVAILNPFLERIAPKADELKALIASKTKSVATTDEMRAAVLHEISRLESNHRAADRPARDGRWLDAGIELFRLVLPLLLQQLGK